MDSNKANHKELFLKEATEFSSFNIPLKDPNQKSKIKLSKLQKNPKSHS
jgi:hypothetical protein